MVTYAKCEKKFWRLHTQYDIPGKSFYYFFPYDSSSPLIRFVQRARFSGPPTRVFHVPSMVNGKLCQNLNRNGVINVAFYNSFQNMPFTHHETPFQTYTTARSFLSEE